MITRLLLTITLTLCMAQQPALAAKATPSNGREMHQEIIKEMPIVEGKLSEYVNQVGQRIVKHLKDTDETFTFTVIDNPDINAFAIQDGYIYIHRGLITYLKSEAQLAAVLAHEIGHVTANHHSRQKRAQASSNIIAGVLTILTRSASVGEASALWGASLVSGYGRDMELEADGLGSQYLLQSGYNPQAMIEVITLLKDHERMEKQRAKELGREAQTYHGLFATHPRNDTRLKEVVSNSGELPKDLKADDNITPFRIATEGMLWGKNTTTKKMPENLYENRKLGFQVYFPEAWTHSVNGNLITASNPAMSATMNIEIMPRTLDTPSEFIKKQLNIPLIKKSESFIQARLRGHTGFIPRQSQPDQRIAVIYYRRQAYVFRGTVDSDADESQANKDFLAMIRSFRPSSIRQQQTRKPKTIHYVKATQNTTFARLAKHLNLGKFGEDELRIINGYYPAGEPKPGEWIKIIR